MALKVPFFLSSTNNIKPNQPSKRDFLICVHPTSAVKKSLLKAGNRGRPSRATVNCGAGILPALPLVKLGNRGRPSRATLSTAPTT